MKGSNECFPLLGLGKEEDEPYQVRIKSVPAPLFLRLKYLKEGEGREKVGSRYGPGMI